MNQPRIVISGLSGGSGKTLVSLGLTRHFLSAGTAVQPFKKGPDYIDYAWLSLAAKRSCACLDPYFLSPSALLGRFSAACAKSRPGLALIEGNRGLFDGRDPEGTCSTAHVARALSAPVVLVMNCAKMTRTAAAILRGIAEFEAGVRIAGVILNNTAGARHASMLRTAVETYTDIPVFGVIPRVKHNPLPERHLGLALDSGSPDVEEVLDGLSALIRDNADTEAVLAAASAAGSLPPSSESSVPPYGTPEETAAALPVEPPSAPVPHLQAEAPAEKAAPSPDSSRRPRIGFVQDEALWFYYRENLDALHDAGAELVRLSLTGAAPWPDGLDGLYLGGGYPELHAEAVAASPHLAEIRRISRDGFPVYAECGGFMVLCRALLLEECEVPMAGIFSAVPRFLRRPQGLGYVTARTVGENPFHPLGSVWKGHEFHYSRCDFPEGQPLPACCLRLDPGTGLYSSEGARFDGLLEGRTFGCWTHLFAPAVPHWAPAFVAAALKARREACATSA